jgi:hypothetical protein
MEVSGTRVRVFFCFKMIPDRSIGSDRGVDRYRGVARPIAQFKLFWFLEPHPSRDRRRGVVMKNVTLKVFAQPNAGPWPVSR